MNCDLIIKGRYVLPIDKKMSIINDGLVAVKDKKIIAVGAQKVLQKKYKAKKNISAGIVMPGLINCHTHAAMAGFRGLADDLSLDIWLNKYIWPAEKKYVKPNFVYRYSMLAGLEMIKSGTTCFNDMYFFSEQTVEAAKKIGLRTVIGEGILNFPTPSCQQSEQAIEKTMELLKKYKHDELIKISLAPHSIYACGQDLLKKVSALAKKNNLLIHIHLSETEQEVKDCQKLHRKSPVAYLDSFGFLNNRTVCAHSIWLDKNDFKILKKNKVKVVHSPASNMKLASGIMPLPEILKNNIIVGLGTDGCASNNTLDMFADMRLTALLHKVNKLDPSIIKAKEVVKIATINGAKVLGLDKKIGSLKIGKLADIITINLNQPHLTPIYNPYSHLVYCAKGSDVDNVIINGRIIMKNKKVNLK